MHGVITSDPFEILQAEKEFYESLYKSRVYAQQTKASFNYDDLPIPKLSEDCKQSGEGVITSDECLKVLNSFALNKTPGNDGLPIAFYQTFWNVVRTLFDRIECPLMSIRETGSRFARVLENIAHLGYAG